jgi:aerobic carbon-monoxide dehydrogenase medium subunit
MSLFGYVAPQSLEEAVAVLASHPEARPLAGGLSTLLPANRRQIAGSLLVDLRKVDALLGVDRLSDGSLKICATTTLAAVAQSSLIRKDQPVLSETALLIGDTQVRNRATIGGNLFASETGADLPPLLLALNARIQVAGPSGSRELSADNFFAGPPQAALEQDQLIISIIVPALAKGAGVAYEKLKHPATLFALCGVAAAVQVAAGTVSDARVAVTGATMRPTRLRAVEQALLHEPANDASAMAAAQTRDNKLICFTDLFASGEYRAHLTQVLAGRALKRAIAAATQ